MPESELIKICYHTATYDLRIPDFFDAYPLPTVRKVCKYMVTDDRNEDAISASLRILDAVIAHLYNEWEVTSRLFRDGYQDPRFMIYRHEKLQAKKNNDRLFANVRKAKTAYERFKKIRAYIQPEPERD